jgi:hypothetical protein
MPINIRTQATQNIYQNQSNSQTTKQLPKFLRQDKYAPSRVRTASSEPVTLKISARTQQKNTKSPRSKNHSKKRQTVQIAAWVKPPIRAELERVAKQEGLSISQTIAALLEQALRQNLYTQHTALLEPIIDKSLGKHMRSYSNRIATLLVRALFAGEQTRSLVTNILGRQQGIDQPILEKILNGSSNAAKRNITRMTPQLSELVEEINKWMEKEEK